MSFRVFPVTIVAIVSGEVANISLSIEYHQMVYYLIHKVAVVRNNNHTTFEILKHVQSDNIEVVGRFVKHQEVRVTHQDGTQIKTTTLAPAQLIDIAMLRFGSKQKML